MRRLNVSPTSPRRYNRETITAPKLLLVEGPDEFQFFRFLSPHDDIQIHVYEGKDQLKLELKTLGAVEGFSELQRIVIVRDADSDPHAALQSVLSQWGEALGEPIPKVSSDQWFDDNQGRQWVVWIVPAPNAEGDLEALLWQAVEVDDHHNCIENLIACLDTCDPVPFGSKTKARLYSWLATQHDPLKELHAAFKSEKGLFAPDHPAFARFLTLVNNI